MNPLRSLGAAALLLPALLGVRLPAADLVSGSLENGVHYLILPHGTDRAEVSLRLFVQAGSFDEQPGESGYAHFVEHMAFDGTTHYPAGAIGQLFQRLGLSWGADLNASTDYTHTVYLLELPAGLTQGLPTALGVLRDYADGIQFPPDEVSREAGVVVSELHLREGASERQSQQVNQVLYGSTLLPNHLVVGTEEKVRAATAASLRAFYQRCYTAGRMTVVIVGPLDPGEVRAEITRAFGSMKADAGVAPVTLGKLPDPKPLDAVCFTDPDLKGAELRYLVAGPVPPDTESGRSDGLAQRIAISIMNQRLQHRRDYSRERLGVAYVALQREDFAPLSRREIYAQTASNQWGWGIKLIENELRYARQLGFTPNEIADAIREVRAADRAALLDERNAPSKLLAAEVVLSLVEQRTWLSARSAASENEAALDTMNVIRVNNAFRELFPQQGGHLMVRGGRSVDATPASALATYAQNSHELITSLDEGGDSEFAYGDFGPPAPIAERQREEVLGIDLIRFANGVRLNVLPSSHAEPGRFQMRVMLGRGTPDVPSSMPAFPGLANGLLIASNLGRQTNSEVERILATHGVTYQNAMVDGAASVYLAGPVGELPLALRLVTARLTDSQFSRERYLTALSYYAGTREQQFNTPEATAEAECLYRLTNHDERVYPPRVEVAAAYRFVAVYEWLERCWLNGPIEIGVIGDVTTDEVVRAAAVTVGTLAKRTIKEGAGKPKSALAHAATEDISGTMVAGSAAACIDWPVQITSDRRKLAATEFAADVLADRLRVALREKLGATYTPVTGVRRDRFQRSFGYIQAKLSFDSTRAGELTAMAVGIADRLAKRGVTREEFDRLRAVRISRARLAVGTDRWWLDSVVAFAQSQPGVLSEMHDFVLSYEKLEMFDVNEAATALAANRACAVIVHPASR